VRRVRWLGGLLIRVVGTLAVCLTAVVRAQGPTVGTRLGDSLELVVRVMPSSFGPGDSAAVEITLTNRTRRRLELKQLGCRPLFYEVRDLAGRQFPLDEGAPACASISPLVLAPHAVQRARFTWTATYPEPLAARASLPEGTYRVTGLVGARATQLRSEPVVVGVRRRRPYASPGGIAVSVQVRPRTARPGDTVRVTVTARNLTGQAIALRFPQTCAFRFAVAEELGAERGAELTYPGQLCGRGTRTIRLGPGESRDSAFRWFALPPPNAVLDTLARHVTGWAVFGELAFDHPLRSVPELVTACPPRDTVSQGAPPAGCSR
jgi:hypothetical protein